MSSDRKILYQGAEIKFYEEILPGLISKGYTPLGITKVTPSLEEVFIELVSKTSLTAK